MKASVKASWILTRLKKLKTAARVFRSASSDSKNQILIHAADLLSKKQTEIQSANKKDLALLDPKASPAFRDRLLLNPGRIEQMITGLKQVAALPDPVGEIVEARKLPNGLSIQKMRSPLGVILMIFESRPNVAVEAFSLAMKSGNIPILRGGRESMKTTRALYQILTEACQSAGFSEPCFWGIEDPDRALVQNLLQQKDWIDVVVPRGGDRLIEFVTKNSHIPIIKNDRGLCHIYVHEDANLKMACDIVMNAKTQRPGVCNAMETLLVHEKVAQALLRELASQPKKMEWRACPSSYKILKKHVSKLKKAAESDWNKEHLDLILNCRVVSSLDSAIEHIERHGSRHSEAIITSSSESARQFQSEIDAAVVYWNASTRFTDGFELGLGGELGISTQKLHVRGPVGLRELTSIRWVIDGQGQVRI